MSFICATTLWIAGRPSGIKITSATGEFTYAIAEGDNGYINTAVTLGGGTYRIYEKLGAFGSSSKGAGEVRMLVMKI